MFLFYNAFFHLAHVSTISVVQSADMPCILSGLFSPSYFIILNVRILHLLRIAVPTAVATTSFYPKLFFSSNHKILRFACVYIWRFCRNFSFNGVCPIILEHIILVAILLLRCAIFQRHVYRYKIAPHIGSLDCCLFFYSFLFDFTRGMFKRVAGGLRFCGLPALHLRI